MPTVPIEATTTFVQEWEPPQTLRIDIELSRDALGIERYVMGLPCPNAMAFALIMFAALRHGRPGDLAKMDEEWRPTKDAKFLIQRADRQAEWELAKTVCRTGDPMPNPLATIRSLGFDIRYETISDDPLDPPIRRVTIHRPGRAVYR